MEYDSKTKWKKEKQNLQRRGQTDKELMHWGDFCLFKVGFNQLINKFSFMRNWCFVVTVSRIEKQSHKQAFKQSADDIKCWYICDFLSFLSRVFINPGCEMSVHLTNITTASTNKFINNIWTENTWIRIFVRKCLMQFIAGEN